MLENFRQFCTKKRMILAIILLGLLTILLLIFEEALTTQEEHKPTSSPKPVIKDHVDVNSLSEGNIHPSPASAQASLSRQDSQNLCWLKESYTVEQSCTACSDFEINSKSPPACIETGLKEIVRCSVSGLVTRSCSRVPDAEKKRFLVFESLMLLMTILSYGFVKFRTSQLERIAAKQIEQNLAAGY
ncbi:unnamed protein product [Allacma fusca]|uniref:Jumping translocation breakpoint protein n=1 Tax=Allacma fusca TaxID=39272 RepID=A0A8J2L5Y7_9HEXA|nr:unnamed protein product [Allacma fusca]